MGTTNFKDKRSLVEFLRDQIETSDEPVGTSFLWDGEREAHNAMLEEAIRAVEVLDKVDTAFEMVRVGWDKPNSQATNAINEAWKEIREILKKD